MSTPASSRVPAYRITLFYGPEYEDAENVIIRCVFNVKKRSWKGGVQVGVDIEQQQLDRVGQCLHFDEWLDEILQQIPEECRAECADRAKDLFVQQISHAKLQLAIQEGIRQENSNIGSTLFVSELDSAIKRDAQEIKQQVLTELDVEDMKSQIYP